MCPCIDDGSTREDIEEAFASIDTVNNNPVCPIHNRIMDEKLDCVDRFEGYVCDDCEDESSSD